MPLEMKLLPHGCRCSEPAVHPKTWSRANASTKSDWYIHYRFYDNAHRERYPKGKFCMVKGMNDLKDSTQRQQDTREKLEDLNRLLEAGYNPITGFVPVLEEDEVVDYEIAPTTPLDQALQQAQLRYKAGKTHMYNIKCHTVHVVAAIRAKGMHRLNVSEVKKRHVLRILDQLSEKLSLSNDGYNKYLKTIRTLFNVLEDLETVEFNPVEKIKQKAVVKSKRARLDRQQRADVRAALATSDPRLALFMRIFFDSGARITEMLRLRGRDVDLATQTFYVNILKGQQPVGAAPKPIKDVSLSDWQAAMEGATPDDYVFGKGLKPGPVPLSAHGLIKRWRVRVKSKETGLGIDAGLYSLKYSHSNELAAVQGLGAAQAANSHTSAKTTRIYADEQADRELQEMLELVRKAPDTFAPTSGE